MPLTERAGTSAPTVRHWRSRYECGGIGSLRDAARSGRPRTVDEAGIVVRTLTPPPERLGVTNWSSRLLFFGLITRQAIRRGTFASVKDLVAAIGRFVDGWNERCEPFSWTKDADEILAKIQRKRARGTRSG